MTQRNQRPRYGGSTRLRHSMIAALVALCVLSVFSALTALAAPITIVDDAGADDEPGQKDLNYLTIDYAPGGTTDIAVTWGWDDTQWSGNNTGDACTLFDTDGDGFANYSLCITVDQNGAYLATRLYSCGADSRSDRCAGPTLDTSFLSTGTASVLQVDPFGTTGRASNDCSSGGATGCLIYDTVAALSVDIDDVGGGVAKLINVCSYPSQEPNSDPSDCVITPDSGFLTIVKVANPDDGTAFTFNASAASRSGDTSWTINGSGSVELISFEPGSSYDLSEAVPSGWQLDSASCVIQSSPTAATGTGTTTGIDNFEIKTGLETICTFNDTAQGSLTVIKHVVNDNGGTAAASNFTMNLGGTTSTSFAGAESPGVKTSFSAGTTFNVTENGPAGYTASYSGDCSGTIVAGVDKTCTVTNDDNAPSLTLVKTVTNDNGGTAVAGNWTLTAAGYDATSPDAGTYNLSESGGPAGYTQTSLTCSNASGQVTSVTLGLGEHVTCTFVNDDVAPTLTLVKTVVNDNGGTKTVADFPLFISGSPATSGVAVTLNAGAYTASETQQAGYTASAWGGDCAADGSVTLSVGDNKTCTITNDDIQPKLTLIKTVVNDNGGTKTVADFPLFVSGTSVTSGAATGFNAGSYTASETQQAGYTASAWGGDCAANGSVTLSVGDNKTCTITNSDQQAYITVVKVVNNTHGGLAQPNDFNLTLEGNAVSSGVAVPVNPGTYTAGETLLAGYTFNGFSGDCDSNGDVTVALGESKTCTLINSDIAPKLHLRKVVINNNGGTKTVADFTLTANGTGTNDLSGASPVDSGAGLQADTWALSESNVYGYSASAWSCVGGTQNGSSITVGIGEEATCTITNDDQPGTIVVIKNAKPASGSFAFTTTGTGYNGFTLTGATTNNGNQNSQTLDAGTYTVQESTQLGWILTGIGGSSDPNTPYNCTVTGSGGSTGVGDLNTQTATINLKNGDTVTCVFENTGQGVTRTQGFWATHPQLAEIAWFGGTAFGHTFPGVATTAGIGDRLICGRPIDTLGKEMGAFWSNIAKKSDGIKRSSLDQARMQLLQQLIAAELNASAFGSVPSGGSGMFAQWETALCGTSTTAIKTAQQQAASFNTAGDSGTFTPGMSADSKYARTVADIPFWDIIKP